MPGTLGWLNMRDDPLILHLSGDFPDPFERFKTPVIRDLLTLTEGRFEHRVISINRAQPSLTGLVRAVAGTDGLKVEREDFEYGLALRYTAPGKGVRHRTKLEQLGNLVAEEIAVMPRRPDLLVAHKLTIEGIAVHTAAQKSTLPYALVVQGNTDLKIVASRPDLRPLFREIFHEAEVVLPFAPWALKGLERMLGKRSGATRLLPCPTDLDEMRAPTAGGDGLVSVFHLKNYPGKNLAGIVAAYRLLQKAGKPLPALEVIGGGTEAEIAACKAIAADFPQITFPGPLDRQQLAERLARKSALIMPSLRESFGLVFIEALFAGTPIITPRTPRSTDISTIAALPCA